MCRIGWVMCRNLVVPLMTIVYARTSPTRFAMQIGCFAAELRYVVICPNELHIFHIRLHILRFSNEQQVRQLVVRALVVITFIVAILCPGRRIAVLLETMRGSELGSQKAGGSKYPVNITEHAILGDQNIQSINFLVWLCLPRQAVRQSMREKYQLLLVLTPRPNSDHKHARYL